MLTAATCQKVGLGLRLKVKWFWHILTFSVSDGLWCWLVLSVCRSCEIHSALWGPDTCTTWVRSVGANCFMPLRHFAQQRWTLNELLSWFLTSCVILILTHTWFASPWHIWVARSFAEAGNAAQDLMQMDWFPASWLCQWDSLGLTKNRLSMLIHVFPFLGSTSKIFKLPCFCVRLIYRL